MKSYILILLFILSILLVGCNPTKELKSDNKPFTNISDFSPDNKGEYLLFHFSTPFTKDGYVKEINGTGKEIRKYSITDQHFAPSDVYNFNNKFYFVSGGYSSDSKIIEYNPKNLSMSLIETNQEKYIEKFYKEKESEYIVTVLDKSGNNEFCDISINKCMRLSKDYRTHEITILNDSVIVVGVNTKAVNDQKNLIQIKKMNKNLDTIKEVYLDNMPNYFTYTSQNQKLYLFMYNGDIVEIDSELATKTYPFELSSVPNKSINVTYNKNVSLDKNNILIDFTIDEAGEKSDYLAKISFDKEVPDIKIVSSNTDEAVLNVDDEIPEVYTRSYVGGKTLIKVRDIKTLKVKKELILNTNDPISFVDNIGR